MNGVMWQINEFLLDVHVKLFYTDCVYSLNSSFYIKRKKYVSCKIIVYHRLILILFLVISPHYTSFVLYNMVN
jgi:hypothetical protein